ncbi:esterase [Apiospora aurea]|uniref:Carboxylic ester hydrolase n=1 Tax=Apiospora aurea TaxID=335848 RepID=A0ABR1Q3V2_9PEZI
MAGTIDEAALMKNVNEGYAVAGGDGGHRASDNNGGSGEPGVYLPYMHDQAQVKAWIHNSIAQFTPVTRSLVEQFYGKPANHSYYAGCSTGGAQGFALAQYHPELFDGIIAGCPGNWYSHLALSFLWNSQKTQGSSHLPPSALDLITKSALAQCDAIDGVEDGVIENPLLCAFDINSLACGASAEDPTNCLTEEQLAAAKDIYTGPVDSRTKASLYPGFSVGSETEWAMQEGELASTFTIPILQNMVFDNLTYDAGNFNWGSDVDLLDERVGTFIDEISPDLSAFQKAGGKMIVMQSWADPYNAALWPIQHLKQLEEAAGGNAGDWFKLFMVPELQDEEAMPVAQDCQLYWWKHRRMDLVPVCERYKSCYVTLKPVGSTGNPYTLHRKNDVAPLLRQAIEMSRQDGGEMKARGHIACDVGNTGLTEPLDFEVKGPSAAPMSTSPSFGLDYRSDPPDDAASDECTRCCSDKHFDRTEDPEWNKVAAADVDDCLELRDRMKEGNTTERYVPGPSGVRDIFDVEKCRVTITDKNPANRTFYMNDLHDLASLLDDTITLFADAHGLVKARRHLGCEQEGDDGPDEVEVHFEITA